MTVNQPDDVPTVAFGAGDKLPFRFGWCTACGAVNWVSIGGHAVVDTREIHQAWHGRTP